MTASYPPALKASDDPATAPNEKAFVSGGGGAPAFDMNAQFESGDLGDFYLGAASGYKDAAATQPLAFGGDALYTLTGERTVGTNRDLQEPTAGFRLTAATSAEYGLSLRGAAASVKRVLDLGTGMSGATDWTVGARMKLADGTATSDHNDSNLIVCEDNGGLRDFYGVFSDGAGGASNFSLGGGRTTSDHVQYDFGSAAEPQSWFSAVFKWITSTNTLEVYKDGVLEASGVLGGNIDLNRIIWYANGTSSSSNVDWHRSFAINKHIDIDGATTWLGEAN